MYADIVFLDADAQSLKSLLALHLNDLGVVQLLLPGCVDLGHQLLALLQLFLQVGLGDLLNFTSARLVSDQLLLRRYAWVPRRLASRPRAKPRA